MMLITVISSVDKAGGITVFSSFDLKSIKSVTFESLMKDAAFTASLMGDAAFIGSLAGDAAFVAAILAFSPLTRQIPVKPLKNVSFHPTQAL